MTSSTDDDYDKFVDATANMCTTVEQASFSVVDLTIAFQAAAEATKENTAAVVDLMLRYENLARCDDRLTALVLYGASEEEWYKARAGS